MTRHARALLATAMAVLALTVGGCAGTAGGTDETQRAGGTTSGAFPVTVGAVTLDKRPERIVALSPTATEMLFVIGAGQQVTAVDDQSNYPPAAPKSDLSGFQPNAEAIAAKNPDLVVISNDLSKITEQLTRLRIPVYLAPAARTLDDTYRQLVELGQLTGHADEATDVTQRMRDDIGKLVASLPTGQPGLTYYYELDPSLYTVTSSTFVGSLFKMAGLVNVADPADADGTKGGYPQISQEALVKANPDLVFLADSKCCKQTAETVRARSGWAGIAAVRNNRVVLLDDDVASRWGPRVVDLVRAIVDAVVKARA